ncbi:MAG: bacteriocin [bacterium]|nr:bacteriocin [bacterium]
MKKLTEEELRNIEGGMSISGTLLNSVSTLFKTVSNLGRSFGSAIRRIGSNKMCSL